MQFWRQWVKWEYNGCVMQIYNCLNTVFPDNVAGLNKTWWEGFYVTYLERIILRTLPVHF